MRTRILLIGDDPSVRQAIGKVLASSGFEVLPAANCQEAALRFPYEEIDLVLLDLDRPLVSGWDVFGRLACEYPLVPIVVLTALSGLSQTALDAGASALMEKPIEALLLLSTVDALLHEAADLRACGRSRYPEPIMFVRTGGAQPNGSLRKGYPRNHFKLNPI